MGPQQDAERGWPFVVRHGELAAVRDCLTAGAGAMVAGEAGTGKSRLLAEVVGSLDGFHVVRAAATQARAAIPFGAFAHALAGELPAGGNLLRQVADQLRHAAGPHELLVVVDDAHWLDPASATFVHHLAVRGLGRILAAVREGEPAPDAVVALWKEDLLTRVDLRPLGVDEVRIVLTAALESTVEAGTVAHLARVTRGNLLYLRELVLVGHQDGALSLIDGVWCWRGAVSLSPRLRELIDNRIGQLDPRLRDVLELVTFGEPLGVRMLVELTTAHAVEQAEDRGLITTSTDRRRWQARLGHPLYGQAVRDRCGQLHTRRRLRQLADAVEATGLRRREDILRVAVWRLDSDIGSGTGTGTDPLLSLHAARLAWARNDPLLAARLARAAVDSGGGMEATAVLGEVLLVLGRDDEAEATLATPPKAALTEQERAQHAVSQALVLAAAGALPDASRVLDDAAAAIGQPELRQDVLIHRALVEFLAGRLAAAAALLRRVPERAAMTARGTGQAAALRAWLHAYSGRARQGLAVAEAAFTDLARWQDEAPHAVPTLLEAQSAAHLVTGDLAAAERIATAGIGLVDNPGGSDITVACFGAHLSSINRLRGQIREALALSHEHAGRLGARTPYLGRCLGELAHAAALAGDVTTARRALAQAEPLAQRWAFTHLPVLLSRCWVAAAEGALDTAVREAIATADVAQRQGMAGYQMFALHDVVRLGVASLVSDRLATLTTVLDGPLVRVLARHASAAASDRGTDLGGVSVELERLGLLLYAAEAAAHAAAAFRREGRAASARGAETRAWTLARQCPQARTPALVTLAAPELTARQREIAQLAAAGLSNREIADRLALSLRTVANHLQYAYARLGVNRRTDLGPLLQHIAVE